MLLATAVLSALLNLIVVAGIPFLAYFCYQRWRNGRRARDIARRAGLELGDRRYILYCAAFALAAVTLLVLLPLPLDQFARRGSPQQAFRGLGLGGAALSMALLYGFVQTGFTEELLFRGLVAGGLARRFPLAWANLAQALLFLLPHLAVLRVMPRMWPVLPVIFAGALFIGWIRIRSGSIVGPWLTHGALNATMCLLVAIRVA